MVALLLLSACSANATGSAPTGQIVARVGGTDVTRSELDAELSISNLPAGVHEGRAAQAVLQRLIDRQLLAQLTKDNGWDRSRDYILARAQAERNGLALLAQQRIAARMQLATPSAIERFIADNPAMYRDRKIYVLDQISFPRPGNLRDLDYLEPAKTLEAVGEALRQTATRFERAPALLDTANITPALAEGVAKLPRGEVFVVATGQAVLASAIVSEHAAPVTGEAARWHAAAVLRRLHGEETLGKEIALLRKQAAIAYQSGYAPAEATDAGRRHAPSSTAPSKS